MHRRSGQCRQAGGGHQRLAERYQQAACCARIPFRHSAFRHSAAVRCCGCALLCCRRRDGCCKQLFSFRYGTTDILVFQQVRFVCVLCSKLAGWLLHLEMLQGKAAHGYRVDSPRPAMPYVPAPSRACCCALGLAACCKQATPVPPLPQIFRDHYLRALYSLFPEDAAPEYILDAGGVGLSFEGCGCCL